jgi:hypothetical protein
MRSWSRRSIVALAAKVPAAALGLGFTRPAGWPTQTAPVPPARLSVEGRREISGVYPHLAMFNGGNECGTGAVVAWAGRLWVVTYSPHQPFGSDDKLYEIDAQLNQTVRPESIGGTPANRMIHRESRQLFIGPYAIDDSGRVRAIPYERMPGRPTGNARHLVTPADAIYTSTMEEGLYAVDVRTLEVRQLFEDANVAYRRKTAKDIAGPLLPGYHGKGLYSGQGRLVYSNNGELGGEDLPPSAPSGCLAEWDGKEWRVVRRNQFTEVTGPGGLTGNADAATDPIWAVGWDHRSVILMALDGGVWHTYRLPKASHTYDGAHGWNTEWPRIRDIGEPDLLMTMHGMFWRFPRTFAARRSAGLSPRSTYLRIVADAERWQDRLVFACDDAAKSEFTNTRRVKGTIAPPGQSQSNLWFVEPSRLDRLGPPIGRGAVYSQEDVRGGVPSEPFLFSGFDQRMVHLAHESASDVAFTLEVDRDGTGNWTRLRTVRVPARGYVPVAFGPSERGAWIRVTADRDCRRATALFQYSTATAGPTAAGAIFEGLGRRGGPDGGGGLVWARGGGAGTLLYSSAAGLYELGPDLAMRPVQDARLRDWMSANLTPPPNALGSDAASIIYSDEAGRRWRLPRGAPSASPPARRPAPQGLGSPFRVAREVTTERDLFNAGGIFYELPSNNAGGIAMVRPIATHNLDVKDYCSWRGLLVLSVGSIGSASNSRIVRSADGKAALWLGVVDDLWQLGKAYGDGGPWKDTTVRAGEPSDPYLMTGFSEKTLRLSHDRAAPLAVRVEVDLTGTGLWVPYATFDVPAGRPMERRFPVGFNAYWLRAVAQSDATATAQLAYR